MIGSRPAMYLEGLVRARLSRARPECAKCRKPVEEQRVHTEASGDVRMMFYCHDDWPETYEIRADEFDRIARRDDVSALAAFFPRRVFLGRVASYRLEQPKRAGVLR